MRPHVVGACNDDVVQATCARRLAALPGDVVFLQILRTLTQHCLQQALALEQLKGLAGICVAMLILYFDRVVLFHIL